MSRKPRGKKPRRKPRAPKTTIEPIEIQGVIIGIVKDARGRQLHVVQCGRIDSLPLADFPPGFRKKFIADWERSQREQKEREERDRKLLERGEEVRTG